MTTLEVGKKLVALCKEDKNVQAVETLYSPSIVSIEAMSMPGMPAKIEGLDAVKKKNKHFMDTHKIHSKEINGPWPNGDRFAVHMKYDVTASDGPMAGKRMTMEETALYTVKDGKIAREEFFYDMGG